MQQRSEETRARILDTALRLFSQAGYDATGVAEICASAKVSKGAFYHHFPTKQALFLELLQNWLNELETRFNQIRQESINIPQSFARMAETVGEIIQIADGRLPMFLEFWTQASRDPIIWQATVAPYRRYQAYFSQMIQEGNAEGSLQTPDPDLAARIIVSLAVGLLLQSVLDPQGENWAEITQRSMGILFQNFTAEAE